MVMVIKNGTLLCDVLESFPADEPWQYIFQRPSKSASALLLIQLSAISLVSQFIEICLKPLGQSTIVSNIFGGILLGPSFLGQQESIAKRLFPGRGNIVIETFSTFGLMFFLFVMGVKIDAAVMFRPGWLAMLVGLSVFVFSLILPSLFVYYFLQSYPVESELAVSLPFLALSQAFIGSPVIACLLTELKILNTDIGRLAISSSMFCDVLGMLMAVISLSFRNKNSNFQTSVYALISSLALLAFIVYIIKPAIMWIIRGIRDERSIKETWICAIFVFVLVTGFLSEMIGQHYYLGPLILGLVVPDGPPLGSALVTRVETLASKLFYPTFLAVSGLQTNIFKIKFQASWITGVVLLFSCAVKIVAVILPTKLANMPQRDAFVLGLILNARGFIHLIVFNFWKHTEIYSDEEFALSVISVMAITTIVTPLIKLLYNPSKRLFALTRCTIQHLKPDSEFRILVCIHHHDSIPTIINLLEVSYASKSSPLVVVALILVELLGSSNPILIAHQLHPSLQRTTSASNQILNALRQYEHHSDGHASVEAFTSISPYNLMHDDVCRVAFDKLATVIILPFHKRWAIDGSVETVNRSIRNMNLYILETAPCSIGILIERGATGKHASLLTSRTPYHVAVLFIGGPDDAESLAYAARMAKHHIVDLTVVRFLLFGEEQTRDRKRDSELIDEYRQANVGNERFVVVEEVIRDGVGLASAIRGMEDCFDLMIVGMHHEQNQIMAALHQWSECPELGVIGDMLASSDFGSSSIVLVIQQQRWGGRIVGRNVRQMKTSKLVYDVQTVGASKPQNHHGHHQ